MTIVSCLTSAINLINVSTTVPGLIGQVVGMFWETSGCQKNFTMSYMLQNVFNAWFQADSVDSQTVDFSTNCIALTDEIYAFTTIQVD